MISICENQKDRFAILDIPQTKDIEWVRRWRRRTDSSFCAYYWPWLRVTGPDDKDRVVPPSGFLAGCYARRDIDGVHHAPANLEIEGAEDVALRVTEDHIGILNAEAVNTFRLQRGVRPWGARTASSDPQWRYIPIRRLFIMLRRSLEAGFAWITFEPNTPRTWDVVKGADRSRSSAICTSRGCCWEGMPNEAFFVKCDAETNPPEQVDSGLLICDIGVAPVAPAEFIMISLVQTMSGDRPRRSATVCRPWPPSKSATRKDPLPVFCFKVQLNLRQFGDADAFFKSVSGLELRDRGRAGARGRRQRHDVPAPRRDEVVEHRAQAGLHRLERAARVARGRGSRRRR